MGTGTSGETLPRQIRAQDLIELWNATMKPPFPKCHELTDGRRQKIRSRLRRRPDISEWREVFEAILSSAFCRGQNDRQWIADFDWVIKNDTVAAKMLERARTPTRADTNTYEWVCGHDPHCKHRAECEIVSMRKTG